MNRLVQLALTWAVLASLSLAPAANGLQAEQPDAPVRIGSKAFTESYILAEIAAQYRC